MKGRVLLHLVLSVLVLVLAFSAASPGVSASEDGKVRVWVQFQPGGKAAVENALNASGAEFHYTFEELNAFAVSLPAQALDGIRRNPNVVLIEEDALRFPIGVEQSPVQAASQVTLTGQVVPYGIDMVQARDVWDANRDGVVDSGAPTGANRKVCIIDSGIYTGHEDFQGLNVSGYNGNLPWNVDGSGHGTHVSGTIAAMNNALGVVGVTPGTVQVYMVRVFGDDGAWAYSSTLVDAANRCASAGANIISMSLGGGSSSTLENTTFTNLYNAGILPIAAAGNDGTTATSYPAGYASVVSVAAIDEAAIVADFSQKNADVELAGPGVSVLSTVPYIEDNTLTVDGVTYIGNHVEYAARGAASGALVNGGLCGSAGAWSGKVVLCERGTYDFYTKVMSVQNGGGVAAILYNNVPGNFLGTLGEGNTSSIPAISLSQEDGQYLVANKLGTVGAVSSTVTQPASGYEYYDGTSMATPHVSAVAALVWSANTALTNQQIRNALTATALDLGTAGRDTSYGYGLVQAADAIEYLQNPPPTPTLVVTVTTDKAAYTTRQTVYITNTVKDQNNAAVASAAVSVKIATPKGTVISKTCTTTTAGTCATSWKVDTRKYGTGTYTITSTATKTGYISGTGTTTFTAQ